MTSQSRPIDLTGVNCGASETRPPYPWPYCGKPLDHEEQGTVVFALNRWHRMLCDACVAAALSRPGPQTEEHKAQLAALVEGVRHGQITTWAQAGRLFGISPQAASKRFGANGYGVVLPSQGRQPGTQYYVSTVLTEDQITWLDIAREAARLTESAVLRLLVHDAMLDEDRRVAQALAEGTIRRDVPRSKSLEPAGE